MNKWTRVKFQPNLPLKEKCRPGRSSVMSATLGEPQAAICT